VNQLLIAPAIEDDYKDMLRTCTIIDATCVSDYCAEKERTFDAKAANLTPLYDHGFFLEYRTPIEWRAVDAPASSGLLCQSFLVEKNLPGTDEIQGLVP